MQLIRTKNPKKSLRTDKIIKIIPGYQGEVTRILISEVRITA